jgi:hypothetical protein
MWWQIIGYILCGMVIGLLLDIIWIVIAYNYVLLPKNLACFYQVWLKDEFLGDNFFVVSGYVNKRGLCTHNGIPLSKQDYKFAILPFINTTLTNGQVLKLSEEEYLKLCSDLTKQLSSGDK